MKRRIIFLATIIVVIVLAAVMLAACKHRHTSNGEYAYNDTTHWQIPDCGHQVKIDEGEHIFEQTDIKDATCREEGYVEEKCTVCGYRRTVILTLEDHKADIDEDGYCHTCENVDIGLNKLAYHYDSENECYIITGRGENTDRILEIPNEYKGKPVTKVETEAFRYDTLIEKLILNPNMQTLGYIAFRNAKNLKEIEFRDIENSKLYCIEEGCFHYANLKEVRLPASVQIMECEIFNRGAIVYVPIKAEEKPKGWEEGFNMTDFMGSYVSNAPVIYDCDNNNKAEDGFEYAYIDGILYALGEDSFGKMARISCQQSMTDGSYIIPSEVTYKGESYAVKEIEQNAFDFLESETPFYLELPYTIVYAGFNAVCTQRISKTNGSKVKLNSYEANVRADWSKDWAKYCSAEIEYLSIES